MLSNTHRFSSNCSTAAVLLPKTCWIHSADKKVNIRLYVWYLIISDIMQASYTMTVYSVFSLPQIHWRTGKRYPNQEKIGTRKNIYKPCSLYKVEKPKEREGFIPRENVRGDAKYTIELREEGERESGAGIINGNLMDKIPGGKGTWQWCRSLSSESIMGGWQRGEKKAWWR